MSLLGKIFGGGEKPCDRCGTAQKNLCDWDGTCGGRVVGEKLGLCAVCTRGALTDLFQAVQFPCVAVEPVVNKGGYFALTLDAIPEFWGLDYAGFRAPKPAKTEIESSTNKIVSALRQIAEAAGNQCASCRSRIANCCWVSADVFDARWNKFFALVQEDAPVEATPLCSDCASDRMSSALDASALRIDAIWPSQQDTLVMLSAEY